MLSITNNLAALSTSNHFASHFQNLATSTRRLSSGLRIDGAADDAAGLAVREELRAIIASNKQGIRNINDAISMIQTADGALAVINEKMIRLKELAEQAATGTYTDVQRRIMDEEFQSMKDEIDRIANSTNFNGIRLLNVARELSIHFGPENQAGLDEYAVELGDATVEGLGLVFPSSGDVPLLSDKLENGADLESHPSGIHSFARIPAGSRNLWIHMYDHGANDTIQIFTADGVHVAGTVLGADVWDNPSGVSAIIDASNVDDLVITEDNAFNSTASYNGNFLNGIPGGGNLSFVAGDPPGHTFNYIGMTFGYTGDGNSLGDLNEYLTVDNVTEDLVLLVVGRGVFSIRARWENMPDDFSGLNILSQENAQEALDIISDAIVNKETIRARLGATQNRLENTARVQTIKTENLQAAESRISDIDVAAEMTNFLSHQIKTQASVAMLSQANMLPQMALQLLGG